MAPDWGKTGAIATIIAIFVAILVAFLGYVGNLEIAKESGSFEKPALTLAIGRSSLNDYGTTEIMIGSPELNSKKHVVVGMIPFVLTNNGTKTVDDATITFRFHDWSRHKVFEHLKMSTSGSLTGSEIQKSFNTDPPFEYVSYHIKSLDPGVTLGGEEPIFLDPTRTRMNVPVTTKDGVRLVVPIHMEFSINILVTTSGRDIHIRDYPIELMNIKASSMKDLIHSAAIPFARNQCEKARHGVGFWQYFGALLLRRGFERRLFLVYFNLENFKLDDSKVLFPKSHPEIKLMTYKMLSWGDLF